MRPWRWSSVLVRVGALACSVLLPLALGACAGPGSLPVPVSSIGPRTADAGEAVTASEPAGAAVGRRFADATAQLAAMLKVLPGACSAPCLSSAEQEQIIVRAIAEHEMRRP